MLYANVFWISGKTYLICQFNDRWLNFNYSVTLLSSGIFLCYISFNSTIEFYQRSKSFKRILVSFIKQKITLKNRQHMNILK